MAKIKDPRRFTKHFDIDPSVLVTRGAFDPILNADTLLFIDPLLLSESKHQEMVSAHQDWVNHFISIIKLLAVSAGPGDAPWRQAERLFTSKEFKGTCLGYGSGSISGSGIGPVLREKLMNTAAEIIRLGIDDPTLFALLPLLEDDIGPDRISDLTTRIIGRHLADFTARVLSDTGIPTSDFQISGRRYALPVNPFSSQGGTRLPVVLVPGDVLRDLPLAADWSDVGRIAAENAELRERLSRHIGQIWESHSKPSKEENRSRVMSSRAAFEALLELVRQMPRIAYDIDGDVKGRTQWLEVGEQIAAEHPVCLQLTAQTREGLAQVVEQMIMHYKADIELRGIWKLLYGPGDKPLHENFAQKIFFVTARAHCIASNISISPETNAGPGPVDFKLSTGYVANVLVELKLSVNRQLAHGYTKQLRAYQKAEGGATGFYVILDLGKGGKQIDKVLDLERVARMAGDKHSPVIVIDARRKASASKN